MEPRFQLPSPTQALIFRHLVALAIPGGPVSAGIAGAATNWGRSVRVSTTTLTNINSALVAAAIVAAVCVIYAVGHLVDELCWLLCGGLLYNSDGSLSEFRGILRWAGGGKKNTERRRLFEVAKAAIGAEQLEALISQKELPAERVIEARGHVMHRLDMHCREHCPELYMDAVWPLDLQLAFCGNMHLALLILALSLIGWWILWWRRDTITTSALCTWMGARWIGIPLVAIGLAVGASVLFLRRGRRVYINRMWLPFIIASSLPGS